MFDRFSEFRFCFFFLAVQSTLLVVDVHREVVGLFCFVCFFVIVSECREREMGIGFCFYSSSSSFF